MSLLTSGPETLTVYPSKQGGDPYNPELWTPWQPGDPTYQITGAQVEPAGNAQNARSASSEIPANGQIIADTVQVIFKTLPAGISARWTRVQWDGKSWETEAGPIRYGRSPRTSHYVMTLKRQGAG